MPDLSVLGRVFEVVLFLLIWSALLTGVYVGIIRIFIRFFPSVSRIFRNVVAFFVSSSVLFQLFKMYGDLNSVRTTMIVQGPPIACQKTGFVGSFLGLFSEPCEEYYRSVERNVFWELNVFRVISSLFLDIAVTFAEAIGESSGSYVASLMKELPWLYRLPALIFITSAIIITILACFGYRVALFYGLLAIGPQPAVKAIIRTEEVMTKKNAIGAPEERKALNGPRQQMQAISSSSEDGEEEEEGEELKAIESTPTKLRNRKAVVVNSTPRRSPRFPHGRKQQHD